MSSLGLDQWRRTLAGAVGLFVWLFGPAVLAWLAGWWPLARFVREEIFIAVYPDYVQVEGRYVYRNPWPMPIRQGLSIPFPIDAAHPMPVGLSVDRLSPALEALPTRYWFGRHRLDLTLAAGAETTVRVRYRQQADARDARYLLTTTKPWRQPLEHSLYRLAPQGVRVVHSNYPLRPMADGGWGFFTNQFLPAQDWKFAWKIL